MFGPGYHNEKWSNSFLSTKLSHLSRGRLDHCPLLLKRNNECRLGFSFRFLNFWWQHACFLELEAAYCKSRNEYFFHKLTSLRKMLEV